MAKFKLFLLNITSSKDSVITTVRIPISEFEISTNQYEDNLINYWDATENSLSSNIAPVKNRQTATIVHNPYFCYSYDEKFEQHQNTQRTLTFSMCRSIIREDRIEKNPFINYLYIGAQLLLEDKYGKHHLMTVSKISYEFYQLNTVFKYECQDSFNYQLSRQNAGYEIVNNIEDVSFIGAKSLDWWVCCKIQPDCNIAYKYLQLDQTHEYIKNTSYTKEKYPELHRTISFSASGTANSVLIALGEQYGLQLQVYERFISTSTADSNSGIIEKYYWFEPKKSFHPSGLKYLPDFNLQSFGLEHVGTSFSSILNVQTSTVGDELITMLPSIPAFFRTWFETEEWENSKFSTGLFSTACQESVFNWEIDEKITEQSSSAFILGNFLYISIPSDIYWDNKYDQIKFSTNSGMHSILTMTYLLNDKIESLTLHSKYKPWICGVLSDESFTIIDTPKDCIDKSVYLQFQLPDDDVSEVSIIGSFYVSQYREPTEEEIEFASVADQIPWLENRLVDFKYFYDHSIINLQQYHDLMYIFENDLRKANAKLLVYSQLYYTAMQSKTKVMADLSAKLDMVGATFQSDLIRPFQTDGRVKETTDFQLAFSDLFSNKSTAVELIDYYTTLADYVNKYFSSEQTFLKNMYLFRQYFYESCGFNTLYEYRYNLLENENTDATGEYKYSFTSKLNDYSEKLSENNYHKDLFIKTEENDKIVYIPFDKNHIVDNFKNEKYYYLNPRNKYKWIKEHKNEYLGWNHEAVYYELQWEVSNPYLLNAVKVSKKTFLIGTDAEKKYKLQLSDDGSKVRISCYEHCLHTNQNNDDTVVISIGNDDYDSLHLEKNRIWVKTNLAEMYQNYIYKTLQGNTELAKNPYIHYRTSEHEDLLRPANEEWKKDFSALKINKELLTFLPNAKNWSSDRINNEGEEDKIYAESFPVMSWYYKEIKEDKTIEYHEVPFINIENCMNFVRRISVSAEARKNWLLWGGIAGGVVGSIVSTSLGGTPLFGAAVGVGLVHGICSLAWKYGEYGFGNEGWTYQDVYGQSLDEGFQTYYYGNSVVYASGEEQYRAAVDGVESPNNNIEWNAKTAVALLFTYLSYMAPAKDDNNNTNIKENYYYKTSYWRILTPEDTINKSDLIGMISLSNPDWIGDIDVVSEALVIGKDSTKQFKRIDSTIYYPLKNQITFVSGSDFNWDENQESSATLETLGWELDKNYWLKSGSNDRAIFIIEEDFIYKDFATISFDYDSIKKIASSKFYHNETMQKIDIKTIYSDFVEDYYVPDTLDEDYSPLKNANEEDIDKYEIYEKVDGKWIRRYTKNQLIKRSDIYCRKDNTYAYNSFTPITEINVQCYRYKKKNQEWVFDITVDGKISSSSQLVLDDNTKIQLENSYDITDLSGYTNGEYWYLYRNDYRSESSALLREKAMLIETNLTEYWTNAYYASKNCRFFLPEFWQPSVNQTKNYYSVSIISPRYKKKEGGQEYDFTSIELSSVYVPVVSKINNQTKFQFRHINQISDNDTLIIEQQHNLPLSEHYSLVRVTEENAIIHDVMNYLGLLSNAADWVAINIKNNHTMYDYVSGGCLWNKELQRLSGNALNYPDQFGGWYDMMIRVLLSCNYKDYSSTLYKQAQKDHDKIWAKLYSHYSHLLLEQSYKNEDATTSKELLQAAQYAFKDYNQIESNYSVVVIDPWTLKGYKGQELQIGDGIEIDAESIYNDNDSDIYKSLIQYLYITDISYDLRRDDNIQLTVNTVKYQDKVIGQLIKLIR